MAAKSAVATNSESPRNLMSVVPHPRMFIEAVSDQEPIDVTAKLTAQRDLEKNKRFCAAPLSVDSEFIPDQIETMVSAGKWTELYLDSLASDIRNNILKTSKDLEKLWVESVGEEMERIRVLMESESKRYSELAEQTGSLAAQSQAAVSSGKSASGVSESVGGPKSPAVPGTVVDDSLIHVNPVFNQEGGKVVTPSADMEIAAIKDKNRHHLQSPLGWISLENYFRQSAADSTQVTEKIAFVFNSVATAVATCKMDIHFGDGFKTVWAPFDSVTSQSIPETKAIMEEIKKGEISDLGKYKELVGKPDSLKARLLGTQSSPTPAALQRRYAEVIASLKSEASATLSVTVELDSYLKEALLVSNKHDVGEPKTKTVDDTVAAKTATKDGEFASFRFSQKVAHLTDFISTISSLRYGAADGERILRTLSSNLEKRTMNLIQLARGTLELIDSKLKALHMTIGGVYYDAEGFTSDIADGATVVPDSAAIGSLKGFHDILKHLENAHTASTDHGSQPHRTKYTLMVMKELHSHILALVASVSKSGAVTPYEQQLGEIKTSIFEFKPLVPAPEPQSGVSTASSEKPPKPLVVDVNPLERSDITAKCILYGEIDGAQAFAASPSGQAGLCAKPNAYGKVVIEELVKKVAEERAAAAQRN